MTETLAASIIESFRQGARGVAFDGVLIGGSWGLDPEEVRVPIHLWHGELDRDVKAATVRAPVEKLLLAKRPPSRMRATSR